MAVFLCVRIEMHDGSSQKENIMREKVRLISSAKTGYSYYTTKNKQKQTDKIAMKKYDPVARKHVLFTETKMPSHAKK